MSRKVKSQLELYMEDVVGADEDCNLPEEEPFQQENNHAKLREHDPYWIDGLTAIADGCIDDVAWIYYTLSKFTTCVAPANRSGQGENNTSKCAAGRRILLFVTTCVYLACRARLAIINLRGRNALVTSSIVDGITTALRDLSTWLLHTAMFWFLLISVAVPTTIAVWLWYLQRKYQHKIVHCKHTVECIIGIIRRVQLVHMGGSISHPLPPVAKLEERLLGLHKRETNAGHTSINTESMISCREMRRELGDALLTILRLQCDVCACALSSQDMDQMRALCDQYEAVRIHSTPTLYQLEHLAQLVFSMSSADTVHKYIAVKLQSVQRGMCAVDSTSQDSVAGGRGCLQLNVHSVGNSVLNVLNRYLLSMHRILQLPLQMTKLIFHMEKFTAECHNMSGNMTRTYKPIHDITQEQNVTTNIRSSGNSFADQYLSARLQLTKLRGAFEEVGTRLWLAEQALSSPAALQYLLPDACLVSTTSAESVESAGASELKEQVNAQCRKPSCGASTDALQSLFTAMASLSGTSCGKLSKEHVTASDLLHSVDVMASSLPTHRDFEAMCESLLCLVAATENGITPAQIKHMLASNSQDLSAANAANTNPRGDDAREAPLNMGVHNEGQHKNLFEDGEPAPTTNGVPHNNNTDNNSNNDNIMDIFTTTIPARSMRKDKQSSTMEAVDAAAAQRERAHAQLLLRELGQHMRRVQAAGHAGGTGGCMMERVRLIVADDNDADAVGVRIETQIQPANMQETSNSHEAASQGQEDDFEEEKNLASAREQDKVYRMGTVLMTADELRCLQAPHNSNAMSAGSTCNDKGTHDSNAASKLVVQDSDRQAIFSEMFKLNQAGGKESAFGAALLGRRQEAAFGDDLSD